jgi:hypothetical protein
MVGGPVRDLLIGKAPHDWDFVVREGGLAIARAVADVLGGSYYCLDRERGTGRAIIPLPETLSPSEIISPTGRVPTTRITLDFAELRGPDLRSDLEARDFTVNAMAMTLDGNLIDPLNGYADLRAGRLRLTHPEALQADPARLLRAVRQSVQFGLAITPETRRQVHDAAGSLKQVAAERVRDELVKMLKLPAASQALESLAALDLLPAVLPYLAQLRESPPRESNRCAHWRAVLARQDALQNLQQSVLLGETPAAPPRWVWRDLAKALGGLQRSLLDYLKVEPESEISRGNLLRWAALFYETPEAAQVAEARLGALRFSRNATIFVARLLRARGDVEALPITPTRRQIYRYYQTAGDAGPGLVLLALADRLASVNLGSELTRKAWQADLTRSRRLLTHYFHHPDVVAPTPLLTGRDVMALGIAQGPAIGRALDSLLEAQAAGEVGTVADAREYVQRWIQAQ